MDDCHGCGGGCGCGLPVRVGGKVSTFGLKG